VQADTISVLIGFFLGLVAAYFTEALRFIRARTQILVILHNEAETFRDACLQAVSRNDMTSSDLRHLARFIQKGFDADRNRWAVWTSLDALNAARRFYLQCVGLPRLIDFQRRHEAHKGMAGALGPALTTDHCQTMIADANELLRVIANELQIEHKLDSFFNRFHTAA
jgi:hypothetical protein